MNERLKKLNSLYIFENVFIAFILPFIIFIIIELAFMDVKTSIIFSVSYITLNLILAAFMGILYYACVYSWGDLQRRTMKKTERSFVNGVFPYTDAFYSSHVFIFLNVEGGKLGVIIGGNPHQFQIIDGRKIERCWIDSRPMSKKLSRGVRFCIQVDGVTLSCDTFITNSSFFMGSIKVKEGIEKADYYCNCLNRLRQNAFNIADGVIEDYASSTIHRTDEFDEKYRRNI